MVLDFDVKTFCQNLKATKPPYECPVPDCEKVYKSYSGIHFHLYNFDHDNPDCGSPKSVQKKGRGSKNSHWNSKHARSPSPPDFLRVAGRETLSYAEAQRMVEIESEGRVYRINIFDPLEIISQDEVDNCDNTEKEEKPDKSPAKIMKTVVGDTTKTRKEIVSAPSTGKLPEASFSVLEDYVKPPAAPRRPSSYYRFIERTAEELDEEIEYDMDEEDCAWLEIINENRDKETMSPVCQETFEFLMDRFEKEAFFQSQSSGQSSQPSIDEDAVCSICMDGECQNSNVILFCDMCNLAVHQECYGVPYIPEGQWLCRRCLQSPSRAVDCCLCPNKGGAFKQTDDNRWAHVVCALWIPEVGFANTVFLEPIDSIEHIPPARWKLTCYICKQRSGGACIQCHKTNCYTAFHVTCAQQAGLFMKIEPVRETGINGTSVSVRKTAYCDAHMPTDVDYGPMIDNSISDEEDDKPKSLSMEEVKAKNRQKMRRARKILAEKRLSAPIVSIPIIPQTRITKIAAKVTMAKKTLFINRLQSYWTLKRQSRNGVPLLRRLQSNHMSRSREQVRRADSADDQADSSDNCTMKNDKESNALRAQLKYWQRLRQDLEKARLLVELIRKREKLKREQIRLHQTALEMKLQPVVVLLRHTLEQMTERDISGIFAKPVSLKEVPDYEDYIKTPMDLSTMRKKVESHQYRSVDDFEADFDLMITNCITYNSKDTVFYRNAVRLRDQGGAVLRTARRMYDRIGFDPDTGLHSQEPPAQENIEPAKMLEEVDTFLPPDTRADMPLEEQLRILLDRLDMAHAARPHRKSKLPKQIKKEIVVVRRQLAIKRGQTLETSADEDTGSIDVGSSEAASTCSSRSQSPEKASSPPRLDPRAERSKERERREKERKETEVDKKEKKEPPSKTGERGRKRKRSQVEDLDEQEPAAAGVSVITGTPAGKGLRPLPGTPGRGRGRRPGRPRCHSTKSESESEPQSQMAEEKTEDLLRTTPTKEQEEENNPTPAPSPSGVNRRTAVLFSKKGFRKSQPPTPPSSEKPPRKGPGRPPKNRAEKQDKEKEKDKEKDRDKEYKVKDKLKDLSEQARSLPKGPCLSARSPKSPASPRSPGGRKRSASMSLAMEAEVPTAKRSLSLTEPLTEGSENMFSASTHRTSFMNYRSVLPVSMSDIDTTSESSSTDESLTDSESHDESNSENGDTVRTKRRSWSSGDEDELIPLEALDLVWAKCRGYPWYPALIINPKMPKTGYFHNGVPIPVPPEDVLELQKHHDEPVYLVLFFDTKRTWQWLPRGKLEPLAVDSGLDKAKLLESKKPNIRKAVRKAYEKAVLHRCRVTGEPNPLVADSSSED